MFAARQEFYLFSQDKVRAGILAQQQDSDEPGCSISKPSIVVVDDQQIIADTTTAVLNRFGFRAVQAYSGPSALDVALKMKPDYLLTDIMMPGMNGLDLAIAVQERLPSTLIVLISGQAGISDILHQAKEKGYEFGLLAKPVHPEKLLQYLKNKAPHLWT